MKRNSFSLIEILIALAVMLVGIVGVMSLFPVGLRASKVAENYTLAGILAQQAIDNSRLTAYGSLADSADNSFASPDDDFSWDLDEEDAAVSNLKEITITIKWPDLGATRSEDFVTYRADY